MNIVGPHNLRRRFFMWLHPSRLGIALLVVALAACLFRVLQVQHRYYDPKKTVIRIAHWQLESGYRDAMNEAIADYQRMHPHVQVLQIAMSEGFYGQWLNTQLIGNTGPDLAELGFSSLISDDRMLARYFMPLTALIEEPNVYNQGTPLEQVPWRDTFRDGLRGSYKDSMQDYFGAHVTMGTVRLFYNKELMRRATGSDAAPATLGELLDACSKLRKLKSARGRPIVPIAGGNYSALIFIYRYAIAFTASYEEKLDVNLNGAIDAFEIYQGLLEGRVSYDDPAIVAQWQCLRRLADQFQGGFMQAQREDSAFMFVQGDAALLATGSWDALSLATQAGFEVGVMDFPLPGPGERWGDLVAGRLTERGDYCSYGVYKHSPNREQALDFLRFLTSRNVNERFNKTARWLPVIVGTQPIEAMKPFMPDLRGYNNFVEWRISGEAYRVGTAQINAFLQGEGSYRQLAQGVTQALKSESIGGGDWSWGVWYDGAWRAAREQERVLAMQSTRLLMDPGASDAARKFKQTLVQQVCENNGIGMKVRFEKLRGKPIPVP